MELDIEKMSETELWEYAESLHDNGDYEQAAKYMKKAARMGEILALDSLADCYEMGWGVEKDENKAKEYHDKAHELQLKELGDEGKQGGGFSF